VVRGKWKVDDAEPLDETKFRVAATNPSYQQTGVARIALLLSGVYKKRAAPYYHEVHYPFSTFHLFPASGGLR